MSTNLNNGDAWKGVFTHHKLSKNDPDSHPIPELRYRMDTWLIHQTKCEGVVVELYYTRIHYVVIYDYYCNYILTTRVPDEVICIGGKDNTGRFWHISTQPLITLVKNDLGNIRQLCNTLLYSSTLTESNLGEFTNKSGFVRLEIWPRHLMAKQIDAPPRVRESDRTAPNVGYTLDRETARLIGIATALQAVSEDDPQPRIINIIDLPIDELAKMARLERELADEESAIKALSGKGGGNAD